MNTLTNTLTLTNDVNKEKLTTLFETSFSNSSLDTKIYVSNLYYREACGDGLHEVYENADDFFETYFISTSEAIRATYFGNYKYPDTYVWFNGYGNLDSGNYEEDLPLASPSEIAEWMLDHEWAIDNLRGYEEFEEFVYAYEADDNP